MSKRLKLTLRREERSAWHTAEMCRYYLLDGHGNTLQKFCPDQFHAATGYRLKCGDKKRIEITIKEVKA